MAKQYDPIDLTVQYRATDPADLTLDDLFVIKSATRVDLWAPPTGAHRIAALIWWAARQEGVHYRWSDLTALSATTLPDLLEDLPGDDEEDDQDEDDGDDDEQDPTGAGSDTGSTT